MNKYFLIFSAIFVAVLAQCPNCPPPQDPDVDCGEPDCSLPENHQDHALFPHPDPNYFWQCFPTPNGWQPIARQCACRTVFNPFLSPRRCSFWFEEGWQPICEWVRPPVLRPCPTFCPDCGPTPPPVGTPEPTPPTPPPVGTPEPTPPNGEPVTPPNGEPGTTPSITTPGGNDCSCPCIPCVWWPCVPCVPMNNCPCNGNNNNRFG